MSLRIIYGRAGSGKSRFCLEEIKTRLDAGVKHPIILLVPEQFTFQTEKNLIKILETGGILKTVVLSFRRMAYSIFNEAGGVSFPHIHPAGKCMIIHSILEKEKDDLKTFTKSAEKKGFVNTLTTLFTEFKHYNVTPELLKRAEENISGNITLKGKLSDIYQIYSEYEKIIAEKYRDPDDDLALAAKKLGTSTLYNDAEVWIDGFAGFTPQEYSIIEQLLKKSLRVSISLCTDSLENNAEDGDTDLFSSVRAAAAKLIRIAKESGIKSEKPVVIESDPPFRFKNNKELAHLEKYLYSRTYNVYREKTEKISLFSAINIFSEIEICAREIVRMCREENMRFKEIAVAVRNLQNYERLIEVIFADYGIPCFLDRKKSIINHPLVRLILSMLDIFIENWSYAAVFQYLKTGLTGISRGDIDLIENYVLECGIKGSRWNSDNDWEAATEIVPDDRNDSRNQNIMQRINIIRREITEPLKKFRAETKKHKKVSDLCGALYDFLCEIKVPEKIEEIIAGFKKENLLSMADEYRQVWNIVMEVLDQVVEVTGNKSLGMERYSDVLKIGFGEYKIGLIPASLDQVLVGSADRSRNHELKAMFVLGANDGVFPASAIEEGVLTDADRTMLYENGVELANGTREKIFEEQYIIYKTLTSTGNKLRISWPIADHEGKGMRPSLIIYQMRKLFENIKENSNVANKDGQECSKELVSSPMPTFREMVKAFREKENGEDIDPVWDVVNNWFCSRPEWHLKCDSLKKAMDYTNQTANISMENIYKLYGDPANSSVSKIEEYAACPFAYFVKYGLQAKERKIYAFAPLDVGNFLHDVIRRFSDAIEREGPKWRNFDMEWCSGKVSEIVEEMIDKMRGGGIAGSKRYTTLVRRLKRVISRALWLISEHIKRGSFDPVGYEIKFGDNGKYPPILIELENGRTVKLTGRIDRADKSITDNGAYLRIVDYKSGAKDFMLSDVYYGLQIQLITYMNALWTEGEKISVKIADEVSETKCADIKPGGMLYFKLDDPFIRSTKYLSDAEIEEKIMKELKMRGLLLADVKLLREMDRDISGNSLIIPAGINKNETIRESSSVATYEQFELLRKYVNKLLKELCSEILSGNVSIKPYRKDKSKACKFCMYKAVCQFDTQIKGNEYNYLDRMDDAETWNKIEKYSKTH